MKKIISFILIVSIIFSYRIPSAQAAAPAIAIIGASAIGATVLAVGGTQYAQKEGGSFSFNGSHLQREMIAYTSNKLTAQTLDQIAAAQGLAHDAVGYVIGKPVQAIFDIERAFNDKIIQSYTALDNFVNSYFNSQPPENAPPPGSIVNTPYGNRILLEPQNTSASWNYVYDTPGHYFYSERTFYAGNGFLYHLPEDRYPNAMPYVARYYGVKYQTQATTEAVNYPSGTPPLLLPAEHISPMSEALVSSSASDAAVRNDLDKLMKEHPELWAYPDAASLPENTAPGTNISDYPPAWPITPSQVQQWAANSSIAAQQALVDDLQLKVNANPNDLALQTALSQEKAKLEQMQATSASDLVQAEQLEAEKAKDLEISEPAVLEPELKSINLDPIKETQGIMMNKFPFSILGAVGSMFSVLVATPQAPSFVIDLGITQATIDLSSVDNFASNIRAVMSFLIYGLCAFVCLRIWSRF